MVASVDIRHERLNGILYDDAQIDSFAPQMQMAAGDSRDILQIIDRLTSRHISDLQRIERLQYEVTKLKTDIAYKELRTFAGRQFDPHLVEIFLKAHPRWGKPDEEITEEFVSANFRRAA